MTMQVCADCFSDSSLLILVVLDAYGSHVAADREGRFATTLFFGAVLTRFKFDRAVHSALGLRGL